MSVTIVLVPVGPQVLGGDGPPQGYGSQVGLFISVTSARNIQVSGL